MIDRDLWRRAQDLFDRVVALDGLDRRNVLEEACGDDTNLRRTVEELLAADDETVPRPDVARALRDALDDGQLGRSLGPWRLLRRLGSGGMGTVFLAERDDEIRQRVAVKVLHRHLASGKAVDRFRLEKQLLATLDHPHIAGLLDHGTTSGGQPYLVMEWVDGASITEYCDALRLGLDSRLELVRDVAEALHYAHRHRVVHRDIKPSNILVSGDGVAKLLDFGIAKALEGSRFDDKAPDSNVHARRLSPAYASPEQLDGDAVTTASDLYSLAVVTFELLAGVSPFRRAEGSIVGMQALYQRAEPPSLLEALSDGEEVAFTAISTAKSRRLTVRTLRRELAGDLAAVLAKALHPEAESRYASVAQFADDLRRCRIHWPVAARKPTTSYRLRKLVRRNPLASTLLGAAAAFALTLTVALGVQSRRLAEERDVAVREEQRATRVTNFLADVFRRVDPEHVGSPTSSQQRLLGAAQRIGDQFGGDPATEATLLDLVAHALQNLGELDEAAPLFERALELRAELQAATEKRGPAEEYASSLDALGKNLRLRGDFSGAETTSRRALERRLELFDSNHAAVAESQANLAEALHELGRLEDAEPLYSRALATRRQLFGERHLLVAESLDQQALLWLNQGRVMDALGHYQEALEIRRVLLPEGHPQIALAHYHAGTVEHTLDRLEAAAEHYERALELFRKAYGDQHTRLALCLHALGLVALDRDEPDEAESLLRQALTMRRHLFPGNHPDLVQSLGTLGSLATERGQLGTAAELLDEALDRGRRLFGDAHPYVAITLLHLADIHSRRDDLPIAVSLAREAIEGLENSVGPDDIQTWKARSQLADFLWRAGDRESGRSLMLRVHAGFAQSLGNDHELSLVEQWLKEHPDAAMRNPEGQS